MRRPTTQSTLTVSRIAMLAVLLLASLFAMVPKAGAAQIINRSITMSDSTVSASNVDYKVDIDIFNNVSIGSLVVEFCDNDPFAGTACVVPSGLDASAVVIGGQSGILNFSVDGLTNANRVVLSRPAAANYGPGNIRFELSNMVNPDSVRTFYARITTHASLDGTGAYNSHGGIALMTSTNFNLTAEVPPYLLFCSAISFSGFDCNSATGYFTDFGEFSTNATSATTSQLVVGTNADFGLTISMTGNTLTSGNNVIPAMATLAGSSVGTSQFGVNFRANSNPAVGTDVVGPGGAIVAPNYNNVNQYKFTSGDTVITANDVVDYRKFTASYIVNVNSAQAPGIYNTTITYICLANF